MAAAIATSLDVIFLAIRQQVMTAMGLPGERVVISQRRRHAQEAQADQFVYLRAGGGPFNLKAYEGGWRSDTRLARTCWATLRTRHATDEPTSDLHWLTDGTPVTGHLVAEHALFDAILGFTPQDTNQNALTWKPLEPRLVTVPDKEENNQAKRLEWGESTFEFVVHYSLKLTNQLTNPKF
jgi:hypothetical protein